MEVALAEGFLLCHIIGTQSKIETSVAPFSDFVTRARSCCGSCLPIHINKLENKLMDIEKTLKISIV